MTEEKVWQQEGNDEKTPAPFLSRLPWWVRYYPPFNNEDMNTQQDWILQAKQYISTDIRIILTSIEYPN